MPGQFHDCITGLYYNRHRFYAPKLGAYISQDPIGLDGGINLSAYVRNPVQWGDPTGLTGSQLENAVNTASNAAQAAVFTNATGGTVAALNAAATSAVAIGSVNKAVAIKAFTEYKHLGSAESWYSTKLVGGCIKATIESGAWDPLDVSQQEEAWAAMGKVCIGGKK